MFQRGFETRSVENDDRAPVSAIFTAALTKGRGGGAQFEARRRVLEREKKDQRNALVLDDVEELGLSSFTPKRSCAM
ncbi:Protein of unknown function [Gryllus bimaculatus]|nr:Protein of unknown function [Gryllus bimaculatus]